MLIEESAYSNRWRKVSPAAKGLFALAALVAAFVAATPVTAVIIAALVAGATVAGAQVAPGRYFRVALPALLFLAAGCLSLAFSVDWNTTRGDFLIQLAPDGLHMVATVGARSLGALAALLFLALTTPLIDLVALLRRLRTPEALLDIMVLCYRMLFVFSTAVHDTVTAQSARLGYATPRLAIRSLGGLAANLTLQVWQRAHALHVAAQARNNDGPLRFLQASFDNAARDLNIAFAASAALLLLSLWLR